MKIRTSELTSTALDWAVAKCEIAPLRVVIKGQCLERMDSDRHDPVFYSPSTDWAQGGSIFERERMDLFTEKQAYQESWFASVARYQNDTKLTGWRIHQYGPTPLIAAMRCYVASKLGEEVEVPNEIAQST